MTRLLGTVQDRYTEAHLAFEEAKRMLLGLHVKIVSDYNGQPYGSSKPSLRGTTGEIEAIHFELPVFGSSCGVSVKLKEHRLYLRLEEIEVIEG